MNPLIIAEHDNSTLKQATLSAITAGLRLAEQIDVLVAGKGCEKVAEALQCISGVKNVLLVDNETYEHRLPEALAPLIVELARDRAAIFAASTSFGKNLLPRVAALLDVEQISDVIEILKSGSYRRPIYAGNAIATIQSTDAIQVLTVRPTAFKAAREGAGRARIQLINRLSNNKLSSFINAIVHNVDRPELGAADIVISGGRALKDVNTFERLTKLADRLGAAIGASRAAVDAGLAPNDYQVGQTGQVVAPKLYIAVGISGAIQHLAGMKDSHIIVAINKDPEAPIMKIADYALEADLFEVLPQWEEVLSEMGY